MKSTMNLLLLESTFWSKQRLFKDSLCQYIVYKLEYANWLQQLSRIKSYQYYRRYSLKVSTICFNIACYIVVNSCNYIENLLERYVFIVNSNNHKATQTVWQRNGGRGRVMTKNQGQIIRHRWKIMSTREANYKRLQKPFVKQSWTHERRTQWPASQGFRWMANKMGAGDRGLQEHGGAEK